MSGLAQDGASVRRHQPPGLYPSGGSSEHAGHHSIRSYCAHIHDGHVRTRAAPPQLRARICCRVPLVKRIRVHFWSVAFRHSGTGLDRSGCATLLRGQSTAAPPTVITRKPRPLPGDEHRGEYCFAFALGGKQNVSLSGDRIVSDGEVDPDTAFSFQVDQLDERGGSAARGVQSDTARHTIAIHQSAAQQFRPCSLTIMKVGCCQRACDRIRLFHQQAEALLRARYSLSVAGHTKFPSCRRRAREYGSGSNRHRQEGL